MKEKGNGDVAISQLSLATLVISLSTLVNQIFKMHATSPPLGRLESLVWNRRIDKKPAQLVAEVLTVRKEQTVWLRGSIP